MARSPLPGIKALVIAGPGSGKTTSLKTFIPKGVTPIALFTENSFDVLGDTKPEQFPWHYTAPQSGNLSVLRDGAMRVSTMNADQIQKTHDMSRGTANQYLPMLDALGNFKCDRTGKVYGNIATWGTDKCLCVDSLSGLTLAATKLAVGEKYAMTQPEFQIAMKTIENLIIYLCSLQCHVVLTAHPEREVDEVLGGVKIYPSTLGRKMAPTLGRWFTDVFMAKRTGTKFFWDTADSQADLKARNMPISGDIPQDFGPLIDRWLARGGVITPDLT